MGYRFLAGGADPPDGHTPLFRKIAFSQENPFQPLPERLLIFSAQSYKSSLKNNRRPDAKSGGMMPFILDKPAEI